MRAHDPLLQAIGLIQANPSWLALLSAAVFTLAYPYTVPPNKQPSLVCHLLFWSWKNRSTVYHGFLDETYTRYPPCMQNSSSPNCGTVAGYLSWFDCSSLFKIHMYWNIMGVFPTLKCGINKKVWQYDVCEEPSQYWWCYISDAGDRYHVVPIDEMVPMSASPLFGDQHQIWMLLVRHCPSTSSSSSSSWRPRHRRAVVTAVVPPPHHQQHQRQ